MTLDEKVELLKLERIDDDYYNEYLKEFEDLLKEHGQLDDDKSLRDRWDYYKIYGDTPMSYSAGYLERTDVVELLEKNVSNQELFGEAEPLLDEHHTYHCFVCEWQEKSRFVKDAMKCPECTGPTGVV